MFNLERVQTILKKLDSQTGNNIIPIFEVTDFISEGYQVLYESLVINNLSLFTQINSLPPVTPPTFSLEDSDLDRANKILNLQWNSPRIQLNFYLSNSPNNWVMIGSISLLNPQGYPYRSHNLIEEVLIGDSIQLNRDSQLGVRVEDVVYGNFQSNDIAVIHGSLTVKTALAMIITVAPPPDPDPETPVTEDDEMTYTIITASRLAVKGERLLINGGQEYSTSGTVTLPATPSLGDAIEIIFLQGGDTWYVDTNGQPFNGNYSGNQLELSPYNRGGRLIYNVVQGWIPVLGSNFYISS